MWIAPNLITFSGFLLTIANFLLIGYYDYGFTAANDKEHPIPSWVWLVASINIFLAYTLGMTFNNNNFNSILRLIVQLTLTILKNPPKMESMVNRQDELVRVVR